ncbi:hypothetical protein Har1130_04610 [Haloarcula sp. CBA1130]|uniref:hypothetical protein n=1 Tax=unclassified Haloarcula TaxID=2624677 RepID=UPI00124781FA|nr:MULTISPECIES: hypothetical protein [unclassified Haloarcula]KAA9398350.1 hypothetical protein Har1129_09050 [Haloarcula sp. CBA1129]KAA9402055.1 hypothetical protein Har1130_04610 [Haloarcula sp. CBA1130]
MTETVSVPDDLYEQCRRNISGTEFESVDEYVQFVLSVVGEPASENAADSSADREVDKDQLEALGYLDR